MQFQTWLQVIGFLKSQREAGPKMEAAPTNGNNTLVQQPATVFVLCIQRSGYPREPNIFQVLCQKHHSVSSVFIALEVSSGHLC